MKYWLFFAISLLSLCALGADVGTKPVPAAREIQGKVTEWGVPTPKFARDPVFGADGRIYFAARDGDKIVRFDTQSRLFQEWNVPAGTKPLSPVVARDGTVFFGGVGTHIIGELDPATGKVKIYNTPSAGSYPYAVMLDAEENVWFSERKLGRIAKLDRASGKFAEFPIGDGPYAMLLDTCGHIWISRMDADRLTRFNPRTGQTVEIDMGLGARPRRLTLAPDGALWVTLYGIGKVAKIDTKTARKLREYDLPGGSNGGPYAVNADANGRIWVSEIQTDNLIVLDPKTAAMQVIKLPSKNSGVRNAVIDGNGRYWYIGSHIGKIGVVE